MRTLLLCVCLCVLPMSCSSTGVGTRLEEMEQEDFDSLSLRVELVTRALLGRLIDDGKVKPERVLNVADAVDALLADQSVLMLGTGLVSAKLRQQGWKDDEILLSVMLVEDLIRKWANLPREGLPLGPHGRALLTTISTALRQSTSGATEAEKTEADRLIEESKVRA